MKTKKESEKLKLVKLDPALHAKAKAVAMRTGMKLEGLVGRAVEKELARIKVAEGVG